MFFNDCLDFPRIVLYVIIQKTSKQILILNNILKNIKYDSIKINDKEVELNATSIGKYLSSRDRNTRKETYFALNNAYIKDKEEFAKILDTIYENRINNAFLEKYNSVLEKTLYEENIDELVSKIKCMKNVKFKKKEGEVIYQVENSKIIKLIAPEGTIVEIRNLESL